MLHVQRVCEDGQVSGHERDSGGKIIQSALHSYDFNSVDPKCALLLKFAAIFHSSSTTDVLINLKFLHLDLHFKSVHSSSDLRFLNLESDWKSYLISKIFYNKFK